MNHWSLRYIGQQGLDCWGLLRLVYDKELGIHLPEMLGIQSFDHWEELEFPVEFCAAAMTRKEEIHHVGIWTRADGGKIVHCWEGMNVIADTCKSLNLRGMRVVKFYGLHHRDSQSVPAADRH